MLNRKTSNKLEFLEVIDDTTRLTMGTGTICLKNRRAACPEQEILLELRADCGLWCVPGGRMKVGETVKEAVVRETFEETGININVVGIFGVYSDPKRGTVRRYMDDDYSQQTVDIFLLSEPVSGKLTKSDESIDVAWFKIKDLPDNLVPTLKSAIEDYKRKPRPILE